MCNRLGESNSEMSCRAEFDTNMAASGFPVPAFRVPAAGFRLPASGRQTLIDSGSQEPEAAADAL
jgi:hypothetical protein